MRAVASVLGVALVLGGGGIASAAPPGPGGEARAGVARQAAAGRSDARQPDARQPDTRQPDTRRPDTRQAPAAQAAAPWSPDVAAARAYADRRPGTISFVVREGARTWSSRGARTVPAASLMKTMFLAAYLRQGDVRDRPLRAADRRLLDPMIRRSDDEAATRVRGVVGDARLRRLGRAAGMRDLRLDGVWGLSRTSARDQVELFRRLDDLLPARHRASAQRLLETIVPSQRWGVGAVELPAGWTLRFKGGWGSGSGAVDHQSALLVGQDGRRVALSITTTSNGTHARGKETLRGVAVRLLRGLAPATAVPDATG